MDLNQQTKDDFLTSKFLSEEFIVNRDLEKSDLVIPVTSVRSVLGLSGPFSIFDLLELRRDSLHGSH